MQSNQMVTRPKKISYWKMLVLMLMFIYGIFEAWSWWSISSNTYLNDRRTCKEIYSYFAIALEEGEIDKAHKALNKLMISVATELKASGSVLANDYLNNPQIAASINAELKATCDVKPNIRFSSAVKQVVRSIN